MITKEQHTLSQRTSSHFNTIIVTFRVTSRTGEEQKVSGLEVLIRICYVHGANLAEVLDLFDGEFIISGEMKHGVEEGTGVSIRENKAISVVLRARGWRKFMNGKVACS